MIDALALLISHLMLLYCLRLILMAPDGEDNSPAKPEKWRPPSYVHGAANRSAGNQFRA